MKLFRLATLLLVTASVVVASAIALRERPEEDGDRRALIGYFRGPFDDLHAQTRMVQGGLAGLVEGERAEVPSPGRAVAILNQNILPSLDYLIGEAQKIVVSEKVVADLHASYIDVLLATREDARRLVEIFGEPGVDPDSARLEATRVIAGIGQRFAGWSESTREVWIAHGIVVIEADGGLDAAPLP